MCIFVRILVASQLQVGVGGAIGTAAGGNAASAAASSAAASSAAASYSTSPSPPASVACTFVRALGSPSSSPPPPNRNTPSPPHPPLLFPPALRVHLDARLVSLLLLHHQPTPTPPSHSSNKLQNYCNKAKMSSLCRLTRKTTTTRSSDDALGQIFVKDLNGKTLTLDDITTKTNRPKQAPYFISKM